MEGSCSAESDSCNVYESGPVESFAGCGRRRDLIYSISKHFSLIKCLNLWLMCYCSCFIFLPFVC